MSQDPANTPTFTDWKHEGVRVVRGDQLDGNVPSTPGMDRKAAITFARVGAQKLWAGTVHIHPNAKTGAHHHGALDSVIYVVSGAGAMRWSSPPKPARVTLFMCRPMCRTKKSTPARTKPWNACCAAATARPWP